MTDLAVGPDGALYFTTGGRRTQSGLYRVSWVGGEVAGGPLEPLEAGAGARELRRGLEELHAPAPEAAVDWLWPYLSRSDRFLRSAARTVLEHQDPARWAGRALAEDHPRAAVQALLALVRAGWSGDRAELFARLRTLPLEGAGEHQQLELLRLYALAMVRLGDPDAAGAAELRGRLEALYPSGRPRVDRELCRLLVHLQSARVASITLDLLEASESQEEQILYAFFLRNVEEGWTPELRLRYFDWIDRRAPELAGGHSFGRYLAGLREDAYAHLDAEERAAVDAARRRPQEVAAVAARPAAFVRKWTLADLLPALDRVGAGRSFEAGAEAFRRTTCYECHRFAGEGGSQGPDLTGAGARFGARDLLEAVVEPSKVISDQYQDTAVVTRDGEFLVGRVEAEEGGWLVLRTPPPNDERIEVALEDVESREPHPVSSMPAGLVDTLTEEEILDLLAYVLAGGDPEGAAFAGGE